MNEKPLEGGNSNSVVKVGDTVRRRPGPWTPTIHRLLTHARNKGILWVPEPLGTDDLGREVLSFIPGQVPHDLPAWVWSDLALADIAQALRKWHDATADFVGDDHVWNMAPSRPHQVICHNDFAPYNCVFRNGRFAGAIDFDTCAPGPRIWDLAYTAYRFVPLMPPADAPPSARLGECSPFPPGLMASRLDSFLTAYGSAGILMRFERAELLKAAVDRLEAIASWTENHVRMHGAVELEAHPAMYRAHARWLESWADLLNASGPV